MPQICTTTLASFLLIGFAAMVSATAIAIADEPNARPEGREMMIEAQYQLAKTMRR